MRSPPTTKRERERSQEGEIAVVTDLRTQMPPRTSMRSSTVGFVGNGDFGTRYGFSSNLETTIPGWLSPCENAHVARNSAPRPTEMSEKGKVLEHRAHHHTGVPVALDTSERCAAAYLCRGNRAPGTFASRLRGTAVYACTRARAEYKREGDRKAMKNKRTHVSRRGRGSVHVAAAAVHTVTSIPKIDDMSLTSTRAPKGPTGSWLKLLRWRRISSRICGETRVLRD